MFKIQSQIYYLIFVILICLKFNGEDNFYDDIANINHQFICPKRHYEYRVNRESFVNIVLLRSVSIQNMSFETIQDICKFVVNDLIFQYMHLSYYRDWNNLEEIIYWIIPSLILLYLYVFYSYLCQKNKWTQYVIYFASIIVVLWTSKIPHENETLIVVGLLIIFTNSFTQKITVKFPIQTVLLYLVIYIIPFFIQDNDEFYYQRFKRFQLENHWTLIYDGFFVFCQKSIMDILFWQSSQIQFKNVKEYMKFQFLQLQFSIMFGGFYAAIEIHNWKLEEFNARILSRTFFYLVLQPLSFLIANKFFQNTNICHYITFVPAIIYSNLWVFEKLLDLI